MSCLFIRVFLINIVKQVYLTGKPVKQHNFCLSAVYIYPPPNKVCGGYMFWAPSIRLVMLPSVLWSFRADISETMLDLFIINFFKNNLFRYLFRMLIMVLSDFYRFCNKGPTILYPGWGGLRFYVWIIYVFSLCDISKHLFLLCDKSNKSHNFNL